jgi:hypothetical protein
MLASIFLLIAVLVIIFFGILFMAFAMLSRASRKRRRTLDADGIHPLDMSTQ